MRTLLFLLACLPACADVFSHGKGNFLIPDVWPTPTLYMSANAAGTGTGRSWANAVTNLNQALFVATNDEVIAVDGGTSGIQYAAFDNSSTARKKAIYIFGSTEAGHSGTVKFVGSHSFEGPTNGLFCTMANATVNCTNSSTSIATITNWFFTKVSFNTFAGSTANLIIGGSNTFTRCQFANNVSKKWQSGTRITTNWFDHCIFWCGAGQIVPNKAFDSYTFVNCTFISSGASEGDSLTVPVDGTPILRFTNCIVLGNYPVKTSTNCIAQNCAYYWDDGTPTASTNFSKAQLAGSTWEFNCVTNPVSIFRVPPSNGVGRMVVRYDDTGNLQAAWSNAVNHLNPCVLICAIPYGHSIYSPFTSNNIWHCRQLINNGNDVGSHGGTHSNNQISNVLTIIASGTSPTCTISGTRTGDSGTWSGTLSITINGVTSNLDMTTFSNMTLLTNKLNGLAVGDGIVTNKMTNIIGATHSGSLKSLVLADQTSLDISTVKWLYYDTNAYAVCEVFEPVLDLNNYIRYGYDRNGNNSLIDNTAATVATSNFACRVFIGPYGLGSDTTRIYCISNGIIGGMASGGSMGDFYFYGAQNDRFGIFGESGGSDQKLLVAIAKATLSGRWKQYVAHTFSPTYGGTIDGFTNLLKRWNVGGINYGDALSIVTNSPLFTNDTRYSGYTITNYVGCFMETNKFIPWRDGPFWKAGTNVGVSRDFLGYKSEKGGYYDIGAIKRQMP